MTVARYTVIRCNGRADCGAETHRPFALTATQLRRLCRPDGWHLRTGGRDICPDCWKAGHR